MIDLCTHRIEAVSAGDLIAALGRVRGQILNPPAKCQIHDEWLLAASVFATLASQRLPGDSVTLQKSERPDFLFMYGDIRVGVEATIATNDGDRAIRAELRPGKMMGLTAFRHGQTLRHWKRQGGIEASLRENKGQRGSLPEREWGMYIRDAIRDKYRKLKGYQPADEYWLMISGQTPVSAFLHIWPAVVRTHALLQREPASWLFNRIFVRHDAWIIDFAGPRPKK